MFNVIGNTSGFETQSPGLNAKEYRKCFPFLPLGQTIWKQIRVFIYAKKIAYKFAQKNLNAVWHWDAEDRWDTHTMTL